MDKNELNENVMEAHDLLSDAFTGVQYSDDEVILDKLQTRAMDNLYSALNDALMAADNAHQYLAIE